MIKALIDRPRIKNSLISLSGGPVTIGIRILFCFLLVGNLALAQKIKLSKDDETIIAMNTTKAKSPITLGKKNI